MFGTIGLIRPERTKQDNQNIRHRFDSIPYILWFEWRDGNKLNTNSHKRYA